MVALYKLKALRLLRLGSPHSSFSNIVASINYLINSCGLSPEGPISASKWVKFRTPERVDSVLSFLRNHGFSTTQISKMVRSFSNLLEMHPEKNLLPKLEFFTSFGVSKGDLAKTLAYGPKLLATSLEKRIAPLMISLRVCFLRKMRGSWIFAEGEGTPQSCISHLLAYHPKVFMRKPKELGGLVDEVKQMGFNLQKSNSVIAIYALCGNNRSVWNRSRQLYKRWGWSEDDVLSAFRRHPRCMTMSEKKLMLAMDFLVNVRDGVVLKNDCKTATGPPLQFGEEVGSKGIENLSLYSLLVPAEKYFLERFVARYINEVPQLLSVYQGKVGIQDVYMRLKPPSLKTWGWSDDDVLSAFKRYPHSMLVSERKQMLAMEFLSEPDWMSVNNYCQLLPTNSNNGVFSEKDGMAVGNDCEITSGHVFGEEIYTPVFSC
ncbi:hypothetical protein DVH24_006467 [Malus domestica]|uniref:Uncharacterized protein n=1 Tax=Malus domestica TaxID=3750 RepID=A0A498KA58_MALDO|nr:hypothetical protein DVH24_006467 [Malus domestica]